MDIIALMATVRCQRAIAWIWRAISPSKIRTAHVIASRDEHAAKRCRRLSWRSGMRSCATWRVGGHDGLAGFRGAAHSPAATNQFPNHRLHCRTTSAARAGQGWRGRADRKLPGSVATTIRGSPACRPRGRGQPHRPASERRAPTRTNATSRGGCRQGATGRNPRFAIVPRAPREKRALPWASLFPAFQAGLRLERQASFKTLQNPVDFRATPGCWFTEDGLGRIRSMLSLCNSARRPSIIQPRAAPWVTVNPWFKPCRGGLLTTSTRVVFRQCRNDSDGVQA